MKKIIIMMAALFLFSVSISLADCCIHGQTCYETSSQDCIESSTSNHTGNCVFEDSCARLYECYPGDTAECEDNEISGIKTCTEKKVYGPCIITDEVYLLSIDEDGDGDPDATDCAPTDPLIYSGHGCEDLVQEYFAPKKEEYGMAAIIVLIMLSCIIYLFIRYSPWKRQKKAKK